MRPARFEGDAFVAHVEPEDGTAGVFRDAVVLARLSHPIDPRSLCGQTFQVCDPAGSVPSHLELSPDGCVLICRPDRLLHPCVEHEVRADGLRDHKGRPVAPHRSRFVPGTLAFRDLLEWGENPTGE
jgi:hypothetical protein